MTIDQLYDEAKKTLTDADRLRLGLRLLDDLRPADVENGNDSEEEEPILVREGGGWVIAGHLTEDISDIVDLHREERIHELLAGFKGR
jgi:hypothetical protein